MGPKHSGGVPADRDPEPCEAQSFYSGSSSGQRRRGMRSRAGGFVAATGLHGDDLLGLEILKARFGLLLPRVRGGWS